MADLFSALQALRSPAKLRKADTWDLIITTDIELTLEQALLGNMISFKLIFTDRNRPTLRFCEVTAGARPIRLEAKAFANGAQPLVEEIRRAQLERPAAAAGADLVPSTRPSATSSTGWTRIIAGRKSGDINDYLRQFIDRDKLIILHLNGLGICSSTYAISLDHYIQTLKRKDEIIEAVSDSMLHYPIVCINCSVLDAEFRQLGARLFDRFGKAQQRGSDDLRGRRPGAARHQAPA